LLLEKEAAGKKTRLIAFFKGWEKKGKNNKKKKLRFFIILKTNKFLIINFIKKLI
jgi:hypothetical protein